MPQQPNPVPSEPLAFLKFPKLRCQYRLDVLWIYGKDDALAHYCRLYSVWVLSALAFSDEGITAELEGFIGPYIRDIINSKGQAYFVVSREDSRGDFMGRCTKREPAAESRRVAPVQSDLGFLANIAHSETR
jgi:hypothetical protein